ncbi:hypothetical protein M8J76_009903 [Diaphorina citri]|nr:hypothetical protein M8J76_009903 [Diaphorina citri]
MWKKHLPCRGNIEFGEASPVVSTVFNPNGSGKHLAFSAGRDPFMRKPRSESISAGSPESTDQSDHWLHFTYYTLIKETRD